MLKIVFKTIYLFFRTLKSAPYLLRGQIRPTPTCIVSVLQTYHVASFIFTIIYFTLLFLKVIFLNYEHFKAIFFFVNFKMIMTYFKIKTSIKASEMP